MTDPGDRVLGYVVHMSEDAAAPRATPTPSAPPAADAPAAHAAPAASAASAKPGAYRTFVSYIDKSRELYEAYGYDVPYRWATNAASPFAELTKPLSECRIGVVTTSYPVRSDGSQDQGAGPDLVLTKEPYHAPTDPAPTAMFTNDLSWDKEATHTNDTETFLPLARLRELVDAGHLGSVSPRFYGVPTEYSQRRTRADAATVEAWIREDDVDVVMLVPL